MTRRIDLLSVGWIAYGGITFLIMAPVAAILAFVAVVEADSAMVMIPVAASVMALAAAISGSFIAVGVGLARRVPWARMGAMVAACFVIGSMPVGTALGVLTFATLLDDKGRLAFQG